MRRGGATRVRIRVLRIRAKTAENQDLRSSVLQTMEQETRVATQFHLARHVKAQPHIFCLCQEEVGASLESACPLHVTIVVKLVFGCAHVYNVCMVNSNACDDDDEQGHHLRAALIPPSLGLQHSVPPPVGDSSPCFLLPFGVQQKDHRVINSERECACALEKSSEIRH